MAENMKAASQQHPVPGDFPVKAHEQARALAKLCESEGLPIICLIAGKGEHNSANVVASVADCVDMLASWGASGGREAFVVAMAAMELCGQARKQAEARDYD